MEIIRVESETRMSNENKNDGSNVRKERNSSFCIINEGAKSSEISNRRDGYSRISAPRERPTTSTGGNSGGNNKR